MPGKFGTEVDASGALHISQPRLTVSNQLGSQLWPRYCRVYWLNYRLNLLAEIIIRDTDHCHVMNRWVHGENVFGFLRVHIHPPGNNHVGLTVGQI